MTDKLSQLRILIATDALHDRTGSGLYVRDLALALMKRGHAPVVYSPALGPFANELLEMTIPVIDDLDQMVAAPDAIHGQHHTETMTAVMRFPSVPAVFVCHGRMPWAEMPPAFPSIERYVATDDLCRERLDSTQHIHSDRISTLYKALDLKRFAKVRRLPERPKVALVFCNSVRGVIDAVRQGCRAQGIDRVDVIGEAAGTAISDPERVLAEYDVVFAKTSAAREALASGCAVVVSDSTRMAGLVTSDNVDDLHKYDFGQRTLMAHALTPENVAAQLALFNAEDAAAVSRRIRETADAERAIDAWIEVYEQAIADARGKNRVEPGSASLEAAARYLRFVSPQIKKLHEAEAKAEQLSAECSAQDAMVQEAQAEADAMRGKMHVLQDRMADAIDARDQVHRKIEEVAKTNGTLMARVDQMDKDHKALRGQLEEQKRAFEAQAQTLAQERAHREAIQASGSFRLALGLSKLRARLRK